MKPLVAIVAAAMLTLAAPAKAEPLNQLERAAAPLWDSVGIARAAEMCNIRSLHWFQAVLAAYRDMLHVKERDFPGQHMDTGHNTWLVNQASDRWFPKRCDALAASSEIRLLDKIENVVTRNYH